LSAVELECGVPRTGGANAVQGRALPIEAQDRSVQRWQLDQPMAAWTSASLLTRWTASHDLVRIFWTDFGVDGCTDPERTFGRLTGTSPLRQPVSADQLAKVLLATEGTTCGSPGERCDAESCVLFSRVRPAPHALGHALVRAGAALQQAFEQELSATFKPVPDAEGQTLK
jgi:hypothetical protein